MIDHDLLDLLDKSDHDLHDLLDKSGLGQERP
jgi:hypothetical protein